MARFTAWEDDNEGIAFDRLVAGPGRPPLRGHARKESLGMAMNRTMATVILVAWFALVIETNPAGASQRQCEDNPKADSYLSQPVDGMTATVIADDFLKENVLSAANEHVRNFWEEFGTSDEEFAVLIDSWNASGVAKSAVSDRKEFIETMRQLRSTIIAFEDARESPESAAEILAGDWDDWRAQHMSRDEFVQGFLAEVSNRNEKGTPIYGATLQAAQALRNKLDDLHDAAGGRNPPEGRHEMWLWDSYLRGKAAEVEVVALQEKRDGNASWNDYVIGRRTTIKCVAAKLDGDSRPLGSRIAETITKLSFPTIGYSNPDFFLAIYEGRTDEIRLSEVGLYLTAFLSSFTNADVPECRTVVSKLTLARIAGAGSQDVLKQIFGGLVEAHRNRGSGRDELFGQGFEAGAGTFGGMALTEASAQSDAQLFYDQHGCESQVAVRFFGNVSELAKQ